MTAQEEIEFLLARVARGDRTALRALYMQTSAKLYGIALRILRDDSLAEEVLEDVYAGIWERAGQYRDAQAAPMTWLVTVTRDAAVARLVAARAAGKAAGPLEITDRLYAPRASHDRAEALREETRVLESCLRELPRGRAEMLRQAYLYGATYADLAENAGVSRDSLRAALRADLIQLRDCLSR